MRPRHQVLSDVADAARREAAAELLTEIAAMMCEKAASAWDRHGNETRRDDCERARRLLPGQFP